MDVSTTTTSIVIATGKEETTTADTPTKSVESIANLTESHPSLNIIDSTAVSHAGVVGLTTTAAQGTSPVTSSSKTLKRCLSVPIITTLPGAMTTRSAAAAAAAAAAENANKLSIDATRIQETPKKYQHHRQPHTVRPDSSTGCFSFANNNSIHIPRSNPSSREVSPAPVFNIFAPRARRYSASYSPHGAAAAAGATATGAPLYITPRVSQLRQEECVDMNSREVNHEREVHSAIQISQSWEDLTLVAENWSCKSDEFSNPLQVALPTSVTSCSSPSPTSHRSTMRLPYGLSPSPTRRTFATRRSMSPIAMRPSSLGPVKRKFELEENTSSNWNVYSPPPLKKIFTDSRGTSPVCQSPSSICPSPDSGTYDGRITPKLFISKLCTNNNSSCSSPMSASPGSTSVNGIIDSTAMSAQHCSSSSSSSSASSVSAGSEPMILSVNNIDEGISISESESEKSNAAAVTPTQKQCPITTTTTTTATIMCGNSLGRVGTTTRGHASNVASGVEPMSTDMQQDEANLMMDDTKSETSSIGGCSNISIESWSCDSGAKAAAAAAASTTSNFQNRLIGDDGNAGGGGNVTTLGQKNFIRQAKKFIVNHEHLPNSSTDSLESVRVSSTTTTTSATTTTGVQKGGSVTGSLAAAAAAAGVIVENKL